MYIAEAWETNELVLNSSRSSPVWYLRGLGSGKALKLFLFSQNARGRSENTTLKIQTRSRLALNTGNIGFFITNGRLHLRSRGISFVIYYLLFGKSSLLYPGDKLYVFQVSLKLVQIV